MGDITHIPTGGGWLYLSIAFRERLESYGIWPSMSRKGDPYANAVAENFFSCPK